MQRRLCTVPDTELGVEAAHIRLDGVDRQEQFVADLDVAHPESDERQHLLLTRRQRVGRTRMATTMHVLEADALATWRHVR